jgi:phage terminase large subunit
VFFLHGGDNPHIDQPKRERLLRSVNEGERAARDRGEFTQMEGRVFTQWNTNHHVVQAHTVPPEWPLYSCMDFGTRASAAYLLCALDPADDTLNVIAEFYQAEVTLSVQARAIKTILAGRQVEWMVCDPEDRGSRLALGREHGLANVAAKKGPGSVRKGINDISERLAINEISGRPALLVHDCCPNLIREMSSYVWAPTRSGEVKDAPAPRQSDHAIDALRYCVMKLTGSTFAIG